MLLSSDTLFNLTQTLSDLVSYKTVSGNKEEAKACLNYIRHKLPAKLKVKQSSHNGYPWLLAYTAPADPKRPKVLLQAHLDVVAAKTSKFRLSQQGGRLCGRGVYDMKFAVACYLQLFKDLSSELNNYDLGLMLTFDEEVGGLNGAGYLTHQGYLADVCIMPDGGDDWHIEVSCNGVWALKLVAFGKSAHGSRPWEGDNAIDKLLLALSEIKTLFGIPTPMKDSLTISQIDGGQAINQVADRAEAVLDIRYVNKTSLKQKASGIKRIVDTYGIKLKTIAEADECLTDINNPLVAAFLKAATKVRKKPVMTSHSFGASDARFFANYKVPTILMRPKGGGAHSDKEWVSRREMLKYYKVLKAYVIDQAKVQQ